jgi:transposase
MSPNEIESLNIESLKGLVRSLLGANDDLREQNNALMVRIDELAARIAELEGWAGKPPKTPTNSSVPPSRGQKANVPGKNKGRRKGRPGVTRELCPNPDVTRNVYVQGVDPADQVLVHAYDHVDILPIKPVTTRINLFRAVIVSCGTSQPSRRHCSPASNLFWS